MKYEDTGLPENPLFEKAFDAGFRTMTLLNGRDEHRAAARYKARVLAAVECLRDACPDASDASVAAVLLGPLSGMRLRNEAAAVRDFGQDVVDVLKARDNLRNDDGGDAYRDARRVFLAQAITDMQTDVHGLRQQDRFHERRRHELGALRDTFHAVKGHEPELDAWFEAAMSKSTEVMGLLDVKKAEPASTDPDKPGKTKEPEPYRRKPPKPPQC